MKFHFQQALRAFILLAFSALLINLHFTGDITKFINPKYEGLSRSASIIFILFFLIQTTRIWSVKEHIHHQHCQHDADSHCSHDHGDSSYTFKKLGSYLVIMFPLMTGFLLPAKTLDASIATAKGGLAVLSKQKTDKSPEVPLSPKSLEQEAQINDEEPIINKDQINLSRLDEKLVTQEEYERLIQQIRQHPSIEMNDNIFSTYYNQINLDLHYFKGKEIKVTGFVYKDDELNQNQLVIARFLITHCVADAGIIGFISELPDSSVLEANTWVEVKGILDTTTYQGTELPMIRMTNWKKVQEPAEPYLYPINVKLL